MNFTKFKYLQQTKKFHDTKYKEKGIQFQRTYPNEDVIRFVNKYFSRKKGFFLDVGCGNGRHMNLLQSKGHKVDGLDFSSEILRQIKKNKKFKNQQLIYDALPLMQKVSDNTYDAVIDCFTSYAMLQDDFIVFLRNVKRILKKNGIYHGQLISSKSDLFKNYLPAKKIGNFSLKAIKRKNAPFYGDNYSFTFYKKEKILNIFKSLGFESVSLEIHSRTYRNTKEYFEYFVMAAKST